MTYHERELLVSRSSQPYSQKRTYSNSNNRWYPSRLSPSQTALRIECTTEERHLIGNTSRYPINSSLKPIRYTMVDQIKPVQFRSEIVVHNNPEIDLHIKRLRVNFHYHDDTPTNALLNHHSSFLLPSTDRQSLHVPKPLLSDQQQQQQRDNYSRRKFRPAVLSESQSLLHQWIDDICANEQLMANDDIVFFIKNGEFFARI
jgi:hypothetical protein